VGLQELVTRSLPEYEALCLRLARSPADLAALRGRLSSARDAAPLFDTPQFTRSLEVAYERMWGLHLTGEKPRLIEPG
jgi:predicted O-linked N-acetylglucosamine transferase (SPINDLY family)